MSIYLDIVVFIKSLLLQFVFQMILISQTIYYNTKCGSFFLLLDCKFDNDYK